MEDKYDIFSRRFFAGLIDGLVLLPIGLLITFTRTDNIVVLIAGTFIMYSSAYVYSVYFHWQTGQTFGKKWMNIRVVDKDENRLLTFEQSFKRDSIYIFTETIGLIAISYQIAKLGHLPSNDSLVSQILDWLGAVWFLLEIITMVSNKKRRALHDILADSVVIKEEYWKSADSINGR
jgi:uncharacterized RDD family membrane protein YckC